MVSSQATQPHPRQGDDESVRITAQVRRQVLREHYEDEFRKQSAQSAFDANDLKVLRDSGLPYESAKLRASNSAAVLQRIGSMVAAYGGNRDNREFRTVTR
jgi:hypothetical protein